MIRSDNLKKRTSCIVGLAVPADNRGKIKECEKRNKYLDVTRELRKLWDMKVIAIVYEALGMVTKGLIRGLKELEIERRMKTTQTTVLLRLARILGIFIEI